MAYSDLENQRNYVRKYWKRCGKCGKRKPLKDFSKNRQGKNGLHSTCKKCKGENTLRWKIANPERNRENHRRSSRKQYAANPKKHHRWRYVHPEKIREYNHNYYVAHKEKARANTHNRYARKKANGGKITEREWVTLCNKYGNKCLCCKRSDVILTRDHVVPLKLGGKHDIKNIQPLCKSCNSKKRMQCVDYR